MGLQSTITPKQAAAKPDIKYIQFSTAQGLIIMEKIVRLAALVLTPAPFKDEPFPFDIAMSITMAP